LQEKIGKGVASSLLAEEMTNQS